MTEKFGSTIVKMTMVAESAQSGHRPAQVSVKPPMAISASDGVR